VRKGHEGSVTGQRVISNRGKEVQIPTSIDLMNSISPISWEQQNDCVFFVISDNIHSANNKFIRYYVYMQIFDSHQPRHDSTRTIFRDLRCRWPGPVDFRVGTYSQSIIPTACNLTCPS
jgi:hypothetical protein